MPVWVPALLALIVAVLTAYSISINLDAKVGTMAKLYASWSRVATDYNRLWNHTYAEDAEAEIERIAETEKEPSQLAATDAPNDQKLLAKWQDQVFRLYHLTDQHG